MGPCHAGSRLRVQFAGLFSTAGLWATASGPLFLGFKTPEPDKMQPGRRSLQTLDAAWMYAT